MAEKVIIDAEVSPVVDEIQTDETVAEQPALRSEIRSGILENGQIYFQIVGPDQTFITIEGLLQYARMELDQLWKKAVERKQEQEG